MLTDDDIAAALERARMAVGGQQYVGGWHPKPWGPLQQWSPFSQQPTPHGTAGAR